MTVTGARPGAHLELRDPADTWLLTLIADDDGTALAGGRATIVGTFLGVLTFALIFNLLTLMDLAVEIQQVTKGLIILAAVLIQRRER